MCKHLPSRAPDPGCTRQVRLRTRGPPTAPATLGALGSGSVAHRSDSTGVIKEKTSFRPRFTPLAIHTHAFPTVLTEPLTTTNMSEEASDSSLARSLAVASAKWKIPWRGPAHTRGSNDNLILPGSRCAENRKPPASKNFVGFLPSSKFKRNH